MSLLVTSQNITDIKLIVIKSINESKNVVSNAIHEVDNPALSAVSCSPDYFRSLTDGCLETLEDVSQVSMSQPSEIIIVAIRLAHRNATFLLQGRAASNSSPDITFGDSKLSFINLIMLLLLLLIL